MSAADRPGVAPFPPAPWKLAGHAQLHVLAPPAAELPETPPDFRLLRVAGRGVAVVGWVDYRGDSVLRYRELFAAVVGSFRGRPAITVTQVWVDDETSMLGGQQLWGLPKQLADFDLEIARQGRASARIGSRPIAAGGFRARPRPKIALRGRSAICVQTVGGRPMPIPSRVSGVLVAGSGWFEPDPSGPLAFLGGSRRLASFGLRDFELIFGSAG